MKIPGVKDRNNLLQLQQGILINIIFIMGIGFLLPFGIISFVRESYMLGSLITITAVGVTAGYVVYIKIGEFQWIGYPYIGLMSVLFLYLLATGGFKHTGPLWMYAFPLLVLYHRRNFRIIQVFQMTELERYPSLCAHMTPVKSLAFSVAETCRRRHAKWDK